MKKKVLNLAMVLMLCFCLPAFSQVSLVIKGTSTPYFGGNICSGSAADNPKIVLTVSGLSPAVGPNSAVVLDIIERNNAGNIVATTSLGDATVFSPNNTSSTISWDMEIQNGAIVSTITPNSGGTGSDPFTRRDGMFQFRGSYQDASGIPRNFFTTSFTIFEGSYPQIKITNANATVSNWFGSNNFVTLKGCVNNDPRLRVRPDQCGRDGFRVLVSELNIVTGAFVGPQVNKLLNSTELGNIITGTGIPINGITDGTNTVNLVTGKHYSVALVYVGQGQWKITYGTMLYKDGTWDLMMRDNFSDAGFEPMDKWDDNVFNSPDLWNKLSNTSSPGNTVHELPTFATLPGNSNKLMVTVRNIGCSTSTAGVPVRMFWTRARMDELWNSHWLYDTLTNFVSQASFPGRNLPAGSEITISGASQANPYNTSSSPYLLPAISAGGSHQIPFGSGAGFSPDWFPPNPAWYDKGNGSMSGLGHPVICLLARINEKTSANDPISFEPLVVDNKILSYVKNNNNVVTLNTHLVVQSGFFVLKPGNTWDYGFGTVMVANPTTTPTTVRLCLDLLPVAGVTTDFSNYGTIEIGTTNGLFNAWMAGGSQGTNVTLASPTLFTVTGGTHACLENITLAPGFSEDIGVRFNYNGNTLPATPEQYTYQLSQSTGSEETLTYGSHTVFIADVPAEMPGEAMEKPAASSVAGVSNPNEIQLFPNPAEGYLDISFDNTKFKAVTADIYDISGRLVLSHKVEQTKPVIHIDVAKLSPGTYIVKVRDDNRMTKEARFIKN